MQVLLDPAAAPVYRIGPKPDDVEGIHDSDSGRVFLGGGDLNPVDPSIATREAMRNIVWPIGVQRTGVALDARTPVSRRWRRFCSSEGVTIAPPEAG